MKFTIEKNEKYVVVKLHEQKLTTVIAPEVKAEFLMLSQQEFKNMIIDLSETEYCDSSGLSAILSGNRLCRDGGGVFVLTGLREHVKKLISISHLDSMLNIIPTVSEAVDFIFMDQIEQQLNKD